MFLSEYFGQDDPDREGPPRPTFMDRFKQGLADPQRQAFLQASLELMRAGGYSDRPVSLPQALGQAGTRGLQAYQDAQGRADVQAAEAQRLRLAEQAQQQAQATHALKSQNVQSQIQQRREAQALAQRASAMKADLYRQLMPASGTPAPPAPPAPEGGLGGASVSAPSPAEPAPSGPGGAPPPMPSAPPASSPGGALFLPGSDVPRPPMPSAPPASPPGGALFLPGSDVGRPPVSSASPGDLAPPPGEPPPHPLPAAAVPNAPPPPSAPGALTLQQVMAAKLLGIDLTDLYKLQHTGQRAFEETQGRERAKKAAEQVVKFSEDEDKFWRLKDDYAYIEQTLKGFSGSGLTGLAMTLARWGEGLGLSIDPRLPDKEAAQAVIKKLTLNLKEFAGGMPGVLSDRDMEFLKKMAPRLSQTEEGRAQIIAQAQKVLDELLKHREMAKQWIALYGSLEHPSPETGLSFSESWTQRRKEIEGS